jgi:hypothetical protein
MSETVFSIHDSSGEIIRTLQDLASHGVVRPFLVASPDGTERFTAAGRTTVNLRREMAGGGLDLLRLIAVRADTSPPAQPVLTWEAKLHEELEKICRPNEVAFVSGVIAVADCEQQLDPTTFHIPWNFNLLMVPEDGTGERRFVPNLLTAEDRPALAVAAAALVGGLWQWLDAGVLDAVQRPNSAALWVRPARCFVRIVDAGDLAAKAIDWALDPAGTWPAPPGVARHEQPESVVTQVAALLATRPEVNFQFHSIDALHSGVRIGWRAALKMFVSGLRDYLVARPPTWMANIKTGALNQAESILQSATFGKDSEVVVSLRQHPDDVQLIVDGAQRVARIESLEGITLPAPVATPDAWNTIVAIALGCSDGGTLPTELESLRPIWQQKPAVIENATLIAPSPRDVAGETGGFVISEADGASIGLKMSEPLVISACDTAAATMLDRLIGSAPIIVATTPAPPPPPATEGVPDSILSDLPTTAPVFPGSDLWVVTPSGETDTAGSVGVADQGPKTKTGLAESASPVLRQRFNQWMARRRGSMMWSLGSHLSTAMDAALAEFQASAVEMEQAHKQLAEQLEALEVSRRKVRSAIKWFGIGLVALIAGIVASATVSTKPIATGTAVVGMLVIFFAIRVLRRGMFHVRLRYRVELLAKRPAHVWKRRLNAAAEYARLSHLNAQFVDWAEIIGAILHRPWPGSEQDLSTRPWLTESPVFLFNSAEAIIDELGLQGEANRLRQDLVHPGWLTEMMLGLRESWKQRYTTLAQGVAGAQSDPAADPTDIRKPLADIGRGGEPVFNPRTHFRNDVYSGRDWQPIRDEIVAKLRETFNEQDPGRLIQGVRCDLEGLSGRKVDAFLTPLVAFDPPPEFLRDYFATTLEGISTDIRECIVGLSANVDFKIAENPPERVRLGVVAPANRYLQAAFRFDLGELRTPHELRLVAAPTPVYGGGRQPDHNDDDRG